MLEWLAHAKILEAGHAEVWIAGATGIFGAVLGSVVSVVSTAWFAARARKRDLRSRWRTAALAVYHKLNQIISTSRQIRTHTEDYLRGKNPLHIQWISLNLKAGKFDQTRVSFSVEERMSMLEVGGPNIVNKLAALDNSYNQLISITEEYAADRKALFDRLEPESFENGVGYMVTDVMRKHDPKFYELDEMITQGYRIASAIENDGLDAMKMLVYARRRPLGRKFQVSFPGSDGQRVTLRATDAPKFRKWFEFWKAQW